MVGRRRTRAVRAVGGAGGELAAVMRRLVRVAQMSISTASPCSSISSRRAAASPLPISLVIRLSVPREVQLAQLHRQQAARVRVERGFPQLLGAHLAQALEAADAPGAFAHAFLAQLVEDGGQLALVQRVDLGRPASCRAPARRRGTAAAAPRTRGRSRSAWGSGGRTASAAAPGCASRPRRRPTGCRPCRSAGRTGRACRWGRADRRRWPPRCRGSRCWRTGGRARPPRC